MSRFTPDVLNMSFESISAISFAAEAETLSAANTVKANISSLTLLKTLLAFSLFAPRMAQWIIGDVSNGFSRLHLLGHMGLVSQTVRQTLKIGQKYHPLKAPKHC